MATTTNRWTAFDDKLPLLTYEYSFGPGTATALAVGGQGGLIVVSPPCRVPASAFDDLARHGTVRALVAPNAFHTMGIASWKERFAQAEVFAPAQSVARVEKVTRQRPVRPIADIGPIAGPRVRFLDMPHYRTGEVLLAIETSRGLAWYVTDVILNMNALPRHPVPRILFTLTRSAPGLRFNNVAPLFMMKDRRALRQWMVAEANRQKPRWLIPAHGDIVDLEAEAESLRRLLSIS